MTKRVRHRADSKNAWRGLISNGTEILGKAFAQHGRRDVSRANPLRKRSFMQRTPPFRTVVRTEISNEPKSSGEVAAP